MAYGYYRSLTIDHTKCGSASSSSFPVLVSISGATSVKTVGNGGKINNTGTQTGGAGGTMPFDLVFSSDTAGASKYPWEIESYDGTAGTLIAWVQVPTMPTTGGADITFYMVYGDAAVNTQQNTSTLAPSAVWDSNFKGVWHLGDGTTLSMVDSTSNANAGSGGTTPSAATGQVAGAASFNGTNNQINVGNASSLQIPNPRTISAWAKTSNAGASYRDIVSKDSAYALGTKANVLNSYNWGGAGDELGNNIADGSWHALAVQLSSSANGSRLYIDGIAVGSAWTNAANNTQTAPVAIGGLSLGVGVAGSEAFAGLIDEVRISNVVRPLSWILTEYNNQLTPGNIGSAGFLTFGAETSAGGTSKLFLDSTLSGLTTGGPFFRNPIG